MKTFCGLIGVFLALSQGIISTHVRIEPENPFVNPGQNVSILCVSDDPLIYCRIQVSGFRNALYLSPKTVPTKEYAYFGDGLDSGHCGITLFNIADRANGLIKCTPLPNTGVAEESSAMTNITVIRRPKRPELLLVQNLRPVVSSNFKEGENLQASCLVKDGRPLANITWYLNDDVIRSGIKTYKSVDGLTDLRSISQTIVRKITWRDNGRVLRCVAGHIAMFSDNEITKTLQVTYAPKSVVDPIEFYGMKLYEAQNITVEIYANPKPSFTWVIDKNLQLIDGQQHPDGNLAAQWPEHMEGDKYKVVLQIRRLTKADVARQYQLVARNAAGSKTYAVIISTDDGPGIKLGMGSYILIAVVGMVVLTVAVITFVFVTNRRKKKITIAPTSTEKITKLDVES